MISRPHSAKPVISKAEPKVNPESLLKSGFSKTHIDSALKLSKDKSEVGIINWMLANPEKKIPDTIKLEKTSGPIAEPISLTKKAFVSLYKKNEFLHLSKPKIPTKKLEDKGNMTLFGQSKPPDKFTVSKLPDKFTSPKLTNKFAVSKPVKKEDKVFEEKKLPEHDFTKPKNKLAEVTKLVIELNYSRVINRIGFVDEEYNLVTNVLQTHQLRDIIRRIRNELRNEDYNKNLEAFNRIMARIQEPDCAKFVEFLQKDKHNSFKQLRNRLFQELNSVIMAYFHTKGQFGEIPEQNRCQALLSISKTMFFSQRQIDIILEQFGQYEEDRRQLALKKKEPQPLAKVSRPQTGLKPEVKQKTPSLKIPKKPNVKKTPANDLTYYEACVVCMDKLRSYVFFPCRHLLTCDKCTALFKACPVCQAEIIEKIDIQWGPNLKRKG